MYINEKFFGQTARDRRLKEWSEYIEPERVISIHREEGDIYVYYWEYEESEEVKEYR